MKIHQIILSETTTAGAVATVSKPMGETQKRPSVRGLEPAEKVMSGKSKKKGPYANSISEAKKDFAAKLAGNVAKANKGKKDTEEKVKQHQQQPKDKVQEAKLDEDDLILVPGHGMKRKTGFVPHGQSRVDHEVEMARSDVLATMKNAKAIYDLLKNRSEDEGLEGWVQEKLIKANDYLNSVKEYYDEKMMSNEMTGGVIAAGGVGEARVPQLPTRGADYSKYDTDHLEMLLRPGILHRNELGFKKLIRKELERRRQAQPVNPKDLVVPLSDVPVKKPRGHKQYDPSRDFPGVFKEQGVAEGYKEPTDAAGHAKMAAKIKKMLDDTLADRGDRHGNPDPERLSRAYAYHMQKATEKSQGVAEGMLDRFKKKTQQPEDPSYKKGWELCNKDPSADPQFLFRKFGGGLDRNQFMKGFNDNAESRGMKLRGDVGSNELTHGDIKYKEFKRDRGVAEGAKVDRMVQHIKKSEIKTGKSKDEAENIAWATANKRGYLDNKNKKKAK